MKLVFGSQKGYTLSEVLISVTIGIILLGALLMIQLLGRNTFDLSMAFVDVNGKAKTAMDWMRKDIHWANQLVASKTIDAQEYTTGDDELIMEMPAINPSGDVLDGVSDYIVYYLDSTDPKILKRSLDAAPLSSRSNETRIIANNVGALNFSSSGVGLSSVADVTAVTKVEIFLSTQGSSGLQTLTEQFNTDVELRNKD